MAVLGRPRHHRDPPRQLRAGLRPARARHPVRHPRAADAGTRPRPGAGWSRYSARALGIATATDLRDYFRLAPEEAPQPRSPLWSRTKILLPVAVESWRQPAFLHADARRPRRVAGQALLAPFDPLIWERARAERLFGFRYRIEIYTPAAKRVHGYYVLPFLLDEKLVARVDLKADRPDAGGLAVRNIHLEPGAPPETRERLAAELASMAAWLGLEPGRRFKALMTGTRKNSVARTRTCPKCQASMAEGFVHRQERWRERAVASWLEGAPEKSIWVGVKLGGKTPIEIATWR